jgi:dimethylhistidine N-methyltransferase
VNHLPARRPQRTALARAFQRDLLAGLEASPRAVPSRWLYDARGSQLFAWITRLPGYGLARDELAILTRHRAAVAAPFAGAPCAVVDLGAGDGHKTRVLLDALRARSPAVTYAPVDLSRAALDDAARRVRAEAPGVTVRPVQADWGQGLRALSGNPVPKLVLFLGSSIGNLERPAAVALLRELRAALRPADRVLVGFDLLKPLRALRAAYDDPGGVTRAFNLNLLARANRELGADFDVGAFRHVVTFDPARPAMESWLESTRRQVVHLAGRELVLEEGERIHTEISCKYDHASIEAIRRGAGLHEEALLRAGRRRFVDALWRAGEGTA